MALEIIRNVVRKYTPEPDETELVIPEGVTAVGPYVFHQCSHLERVTLPSTLQRLHFGAFYECKALEEIVIPEGVERIDSCAFMGCENLDEVTIPASVKHIGFQAFEETPWRDCCPEAFLICGDGILLHYRGWSPHVTVPEGVRRIGACAFWYSDVESVVMPDSVIAIEDSAFQSCRKLAHCPLPPHLERIGGSAFEDCGSLQRVRIPDCVTYIGYRAFQNCDTLTEVFIPDSVELIEGEAFRGVPWVSSQPEGPVIAGNGILIEYNLPESGHAVIPETVRRIADDAFFWLRDRLKTVTMPDTGIFVEKWAFVFAGEFDLILQRGAVQARLMHWLYWGDGYEMELHLLYLFLRTEDPQKRRRIAECIGYQPLRVPLLLFLWEAYGMEECRQAVEQPALVDFLENRASCHDPATILKFLRLGVVQPEDLDAAAEHLNRWDALFEKEITALHKLKQDWMEGRIVS